MREGADITCQHCGRQNSPDARFCNGCGHRIDGVCASCGHANEPGFSILQQLRSKPDRGRKPGAAGSPRIRCKRLPSLPATERAGVAILLPLRPSRLEDARGHMGVPWQNMVRYRVPLQRVLIMSVVSAGLYLLYWFYLTWKHFRDSTDRDAISSLACADTFGPDILSLQNPCSHASLQRSDVHAESGDDHLTGMGCSHRY